MPGTAGRHRESSQLWSAPAERRGDGAMVRHRKRCRATTTPARLPRRGLRACHRTL